MAINLGSTAISDIKLGETQVEKVYLGNEQIWGGSPTPVDPQYGEVVLYGYSVTQTVIDNVSGGDVGVKDETMVQEVVSMGGITPPITITIEGNDIESPWSWNVTTDQPSIWIDSWTLSEAFSITVYDSPFTVTFTLESVGGIQIDTSTTTTRTLASVTEFNQYVCAQDQEIMANNIPVKAVKEFRVGSNITSTPNDFLRGVTNLDSFSFATNSNLTTIGNNFLTGAEVFDQPIDVPSGVTSIGDEFVHSCTNFNSAITLPNTILSIGSAFLAASTSFNQPLTLPEGLTSIGGNLLTSDYAFNKPLVLPSTLTSLGNNPLMYVRDMTSYVDVGSLSASIVATSINAFTAINSTALAYVTGIKIKGANRTAWRNKFPNRTSVPYRKLIDGGA